MSMRKLHNLKMTSKPSILMASFKSHKAFSAKYEFNRFKKKRQKHQYVRCSANKIQISQFVNARRLFYLFKRGKNVKYEQ